MDGVKPAGCESRNCGPIARAVMACIALHDQSDHWWSWLDQGPLRDGHSRNTLTWPEYEAFAMHHAERRRGNRYTPAQRALLDLP